MNRIFKPEDFRLCYVDKPWAWFTSLENVTDQWGDDWNDRPYECNAGDPYEWRENCGLPYYELRKVAYDAWLDAPVDLGCFSVQDMNVGQIAWLQPFKYAIPDVPADAVIMAGTPFPRFVELVGHAKGHVYMRTG